MTLRRGGGVLALLAVVFTSDVLLDRGGHSTLVIGALDEPAHLATAALCVMALAPSAWDRHRREVEVVLAAAVLIDLDHIPLYAGVVNVAAGGRPFTHSLATSVVLAGVGCVVPRRARRWFVAAAAGVCLHLVRDIATGPGVPLLWPVTRTSLMLPYSAYVIAVLGATAVAMARAARRVSGDPRSTRAPSTPRR